MVSSKQPALFVIDLEYVEPVEVIDGLMQAHMDWVKGRYDDGVFLLSGRKDPRTGGIILATGTSTQAVEDLAAEDPFVVNGAARVAVTRFQPSTVSDKFRELFAN